MTTGQAKLLLLAGAAVALALAAVALIVPRTIAAGWLIALMFASTVPLGSLTLLMIHRLTGGRWGDGLAPVLEPAAASVPLIALLFIPLLPALPLLYPWVAGAAGGGGTVGTLYLNVPSFILRALLALAGWSALAILLPRLRGTAGQLCAACGLVFHAVAVTLISVDWILSIEPPFISTSFGLSVAITQIIAALAFAAFLLPDDIEARIARDLGGLMLAMTLAITYVDFMAVLIIWYGDLPNKVFWLVERTAAPWRGLAIASFVLAAVVPILLLLLARVRESPIALRRTAILIFVGQGCYHAVLLAPTFGAWSLAPAFVALLAIVTLTLGGIGLGARFASSGSRYDVR